MYDQLSVSDVSDCSMFVGYSVAYALPSSKIAFDALERDSGYSKPYGGGSIPVGARSGETFYARPSCYDKIRGERAVC